MKFLSFFLFVPLLASCSTSNTSPQLLSSRTNDKATSSSQENLVEDDNALGEKSTYPQMPDCAGIPQKMATAFNKFVTKVDRDYLIV